MDLIDLKQNFGDYSMFFLPEARIRRRELVSLWCLASTQSKYIGPNQRSMCSVKNSVLPHHSNLVKSEKERTQPMAD